MVNLPGPIFLPLRKIQTWKYTIQSQAEFSYHNKISNFVKAKIITYSQSKLKGSIQAPQAATEKPKLEVTSSYPYSVAR